MGVKPWGKLHFIRRASAEKVQRWARKSSPALSEKKNPALAHGALSLTALGFQRLAVSHLLARDS
jgi:hypothetical protein